MIKVVRKWKGLITIPKNQMQKDDIYFGESDTKEDVIAESKPKQTTKRTKKADKVESNEK